MRIRKTFAELAERTSGTVAAIVMMSATLTACTDSPAERDIGEVPQTGSTAPAPPSNTQTPKLKVETVASGLSHGWDLGFLPDGKVLVSQRPAKFALLSKSTPGATVTEVKADLSDVLVQGEGGLMGLVVHPDFAETRRFTTCQTHTENGAPADIRLVTWRLAEDGLVARREKELLTGLPLNPSGRHSGCRPTLDRDGALLVGTGDTANPDYPQDLNSLGGKVLRLNLDTGEPWPGNPFEKEDGPKRYVYTYGHRNIQGVALRPDSDQVFTAEHGPTKNDEVNLIEAGKNYGWDPSRGGTVDDYDEQVDMTDLQRFPDAVAAKWQTGDTTEAVCAATFLDGEQWGALDGALVITALKGAKVIVLSLSEQGDVTSVAVPQEFRAAFGRLRAVRTGPDGALYVATSNGTDDVLLRVTPA